MGELGVNPSCAATVDLVPTGTGKSDPNKQTFRAEVLSYNSSETRSFFMERYRPTERHLHSVHSTDLQNVQNLQNKWNRTLGLPADHPGKMENYNPVLARWNYERTQTDEQRELFKSNELKNITTALRERNDTQESRLVFSIDADRRIRNDAFPEEPYEVMLDRGLRYREEHGSQDLERERAETTSFKEIQQVLTAPETPIGTTYFVVSQESEVEDSPYKQNFVDGYQSAIDSRTGELKINYVRFASSLTKDDYAFIAEQLEPGFLVRKKEEEAATGKSIPLDAWYLQNPFKLPAEKGLTIDTAFAEHFAPDIEAMKEEEWKKLDEIYLPYKLYLLDQITKEDFDPVSIAKAYNILLLSKERKNLQIQEDEHVIFDAKKKTLHADAYRYVSLMADKHGHEQAEEVKVGCGTSESIAVGGSGGGMFENSVAQFGTNNKESANKCSICGGDASDKHYHCPQSECETRYEDETDREPEKRTKLCPCGFKFGC